MQLSIAQQYMFSNGYPDLVAWAKSIVTKHHKPSVPTDITFTAGSVGVDTIRGKVWVQHHC